LLKIHVCLQFFWNHPVVIYVCKLYKAYLKKTFKLNLNIPLSDRKVVVPGYSQTFSAHCHWHTCWHAYIRTTEYRSADFICYFVYHFSNIFVRDIYRVRLGTFRPLNMPINMLLRTLTKEALGISLVYLQY